MPKEREKKYFSYGPLSLLLNILGTALLKQSSGDLASSFSVTNLPTVPTRFGHALIEAPRGVQMVVAYATTICTVRTDRCIPRLDWKNVRCAHATGGNRWRVPRIFRANRGPA